MKRSPAVRARQHASGIFEIGSTPARRQQGVSGAECRDEPGDGKFEI